MKRLIILAAALAACANDAITYVHQFHPEAECTSVHQDPHGPDVAACAVGSDRWLCAVQWPMAQCQRLVTGMEFAPIVSVPPEAPR